MPLQITDKPVGFSPGFVAPGWDCGGSVASELLTTEQVLSDGCKMNAPRGRSDWQCSTSPGYSRGAAEYHVRQGDRVIAFGLEVDSATVDLLKVGTSTSVSASALHG